jgi:class III poly(R)-hydroxyalkanoic acid synthase PhaE subunit
MAIFNIKNAELQYMMYQQGNKVMDKLVENITNKVENGTEISSMTALYQEWLNISDKVYVELFESDEYSKLMAEVSALQMKLRKEMDLQTEKMLGGLPVATRSEMDELYKVIYDLKKEVRQLEKMMEIDSNETAAEPVAKKTATKK